ncbi:hypothetical protein X566_20210 [Afipia sp. P52-10]|uniref:hypothetical protein n=1 Tax=Afipia sp. P52-10 TaxID=1429916 RepID=UPI0003DF2893|nr:hypothetical protein [Afipia sp. P52-10]ETR75922.1 hypothetical protein X566_20210 [Afipia sp. P52-10]
MKIDPMPALRVSATLKINADFNRRASETLHRDHAYRRKREVANAVLRGEQLEPKHAFAREAEMRGVTLIDLAAIVAAKPDAIDEREARRQELLIAIDQAATPDELAAILKKLPG